MIEIEQSVGYPQSPEAVFAAVTDLAGYPAWQPDVLEVRVTDGGDVGPGTQVTQVRKVMGRRAEVRLTVTRYDAGRVLTLETEPDATPAVTQSYTVRPDAFGTVLDFRLTLDGVPKMAEHLVRTQLGRQAPHILERLGALLSPAAIA
ncbi:SRPBCC family protein [Yinghuangia seranimata]|uniref:SRPBCC family protein n=1 Tax=Yinghuangia seranimata TaxID=408067 RepID=UPI00248C7781|nr:SRPBCC family protein [Yinghuangia seranimata]MDI2127046.1 SRPBCC family protein [Yinghuangia seranimata]